MSEPQTIPSTETTPRAKPFKLVHNKSPQFQTYHADGSWSIHGSNNNLDLFFFVEHPKLAESVICQVTPDGKAFTGQNEVVGSGENDPDHFVITREMQCSVVLSLDVARLVRDQIDYFIKSKQPKVS